MTYEPLQNSHTTSIIRYMQTVGIHTRMSTVTHGTSRRAVLPSRARLVWNEGRGVQGVGRASGIFEQAISVEREVHTWVRWDNLKSRTIARATHFSSSY